MEESFVIDLGNKTYRIIPYCETDCTTYEILTTCEKLFTLKMSADGTWKTLEANVIPIDKALIAEIGDAIIKHYKS
jgi:hypothetical protein